MLNRVAVSQEPSEHLGSDPLPTMFGYHFDNEDFFGGVDNELPNLEVVLIEGLAKLAEMMGTSITRLEDTYHRFLKSDDQYGTAVDGYGQAVGQ
jgi:hypothetical protein